MTKVYSIELKDVEVLEDEETGEFKRFYKDVKKYPVLLTNFSLSRGKKWGLTKSSLIADIMRLEDIDSDDKESRNKSFEAVDATEMQKVIYLGFIGANKSTELTFDDFLEKFHYSLEETIELYVGLITNVMGDESNNFAKGLKNSTSAKKATGKKK